MSFKTKTIQYLVCDSCEKALTEANAMIYMIGMEYEYKIADGNYIDQKIINKKDFHYECIYAILNIIYKSAISKEDKIRFLQQKLNFPDENYTDFYIQTSFIKDKF